MYANLLPPWHTWWSYYPRPSAFWGLVLLTLAGCDPVEHLPGHLTRSGGDFDLPQTGGPCEFRVVPTDVMLRSRDLGQPDPGIIVARSSDGRFLTNAAYEAQVVLLWNAEGEFDQRIGGPGNGPEELGRVHGILPDSDGGAHVIHGNGRWSRIDDKPLLTPLGHHAALASASQRNVLLVADSLIVVVGTQSGGRPSRGAILAQADGRAELVAEFSAGGGETGSWMAAMPSLASSGNDESFWLGPWLDGRTSYRLEERDLNGHVLRVLERTHSWPIAGPVPTGEGLASVRIDALAPGIILMGITIPPERRGRDDFRYFYEVIDTARDVTLATGQREGPDWDPRLAFTALVRGPGPTTMTYSSHRTVAFGAPSILLGDFLDKPSAGDDHQESCSSGQIAEWATP